MFNVYLYPFTVSVKFWLDSMPQMALTILSLTRPHMPVGWFRRNDSQLKVRAPENLYHPQGWDTLIQMVTQQRAQTEEHLFLTLQITVLSSYGALPRDSFRPSKP